MREATGAVRPGWVVLVFAAVAVALVGGLNLSVAALGLQQLEPLGSPRLLFFTVPTLLAGAVATAVTWALFRVPTNLEAAAPARRFAQGLALGALALCVVGGVPALVGATPLGLGTWTTGQLALHVVTLAPAGVGEELLLRGLGFRALARSLGPAPAVALTGGLFGALHLLNPEASWVAAAVITLVGAWFGTLAWRTGSLWLPMGLHVAWNFFEGFVFGQPVSGMAPGSSLLRPLAATEAGFWSGGAFGPEAAGWTALVLAAALALSVWWPARAP